MVIDLNGVKGLVGGSWTVPGKPCDSCKTGAATVYCRPDSAFLCLGCDARIHSANKLATRHKRVWLCDVCEQAPAAVTCKADAAALCVTCDADIHSANPLSQRHERVPVEPFFDSADSLVKSSALNLLAVPTDAYSHHCSDDASGGDSQHYDEIETASLLLPNLNANSGSTFFPEMDDPFIDFSYSKPVDSRIQSNNCHGSGTDSVVPVQTEPLAAPVINHHSQEINCFNMEFCRSKLSSFGYPSHSICQTVSSSSLDVGVVPDGNCNSISDISYTFGRNMAAEPAVITTTTAATEAAQPTQLYGIDREARVLRYREKRKNRKFEKTIRYASRKAYAETRPRIKGRFAKRIETGAETERLYGGAGADMYLGDCQYGVVPSF